MKRDNHNLFFLRSKDAPDIIFIGSVIGLQHRGEKFRRMGDEAVCEAEDVMGLTEEDPFVLKWADQHTNILRMFLFMQGDDGGEHSAQELVRKSHLELVALCVQAQ